MIWKKKKPTPAPQSKKKAPEVSIEAWSTHQVNWTEVRSGRSVALSAHAFDDGKIKFGVQTIESPRLTYEQIYEGLAILKARQEK